MQLTSQTKTTDTKPIVYVIQDIPGSKMGTPKINIIGATQFGKLKVLLPENSQIILSPNYVVTTLRTAASPVRPPADPPVVHPTVCTVAVSSRVPHHSSSITFRYARSRSALTIVRSYRPAGRSFALCSVRRRSPYSNQRRSHRQTRSWWTRSPLTGRLTCCWTSPAGGPSTVDWGVAQRVRQALTTYS